MAGSRARGFTLIELLVVMVIIGFTARAFTIAVIRNDGVERELERLSRALEMAAERAEIGGTPIAADFLPGSYRFSRLDIRGNWLPLPGEAPFAEHPLLGDLVWRGLEVDGQRAAPRLVFSSVMPMFILRVGTPHGEVRLVGEPTGAVALLRDGDITL